ncbi:hypothetical protein ACFSQZ_12700 [Rubritalea spongiae]|uniref:DUF4412 domain-containing protein n=2 Tax=Rubritalea spongiae TaxID=430797 RepID=A0ABW5E4Q8_9BACT
MVSPVYASNLDKDAEVVSLEGEKIELLVVEPATVFATKKGGRRLGVYPIDTKLQLLGMTDKGYKVKGQATHSLVTGWVSPSKLAAKDPKFIENLKKHYEREMQIRELIANSEVAIGMTAAEVAQAIGEPTKKESKQTKDGMTGTWEYSKGRERKMYTNTVDPSTGQVYRKFSHIVYEETEKLTIEFEDDVVSSIASMENAGVPNVKVIVPPVIFGYY